MGEVLEVVGNGRLDVRGWVTTYETDARGLCVWVCPRCEELLGVPEHEIKGKRWAKYIHPEDLPKVSAAVGQGVAARDEYCVEFRQIMADGFYHRLRAYGVPVFAPAFVGHAGASIVLD